MSGAELRQVSPAAARNLGPIVELLRKRLPTQGRMLEIASGPGQHVVAYAEALPRSHWLPSDIAPAALTSISAWIAQSGVTNVDPPRRIDVSAPDWSDTVAPPLAGIVAVNLCHIAPWSASVGLLRGAGRVLDDDGVLLIYGPFMRDGEHTAPSNAAFDRSLRAQDPGWGVRDVAALDTCALDAGLERAHWHVMPSNNAILEFRRARTRSSEAPG